MFMSQLNSMIELPIEEVMGDRFGRYSKYIIQDRALPDVRDGLKPVQRRILYAMHVDKNTHDKNFRKAAKTVGTVIGNYHPHGDSSVYDAMVRLSQDWKMRYDLIEMHGNNGSIDGDPPAAMRYTEARLAKITSELLQDIEKDTVDFIPNFDDTNEEPIVFPAKLPNLLINGSTGISAGYATNIPPHNLDEVIDAVILKIDKPTASVDDLMAKIKGPDFPTGGIVQGIDGIKQAYETGKGRVVVRGKVSIEKMKGNREQIVIHEIPYDVNKANLVRKIDELNVDRKVEGISEVRDETDRTGLRIVIDLRKDADSEGIINFLYKNTELQVVYHYNMVAIQDKTPKLLSLQNILDAYIIHQKEVVTRQTTFDLKKAKERAHIVDGLIKAISILDELIQTIRQSKNRADAKHNIIKEYEFSEAQAEAILTLKNILDAYIIHQKEVVTRQTTFDLKKAKERAHIVDGLIKAISILDELIQTIRQSKNRADAKHNIIKEYEFSEAQAEAILTLQLYRLTNTDITQLTKEKEELKENIATYEDILNNPKTLMNLIKKTLRQLKKAYASKRRTKVEAEIEEIKINIEVTVPSETVIVSVTNEGYIKRTSPRSYSASNGEDIGLRQNDYVIRCFETNTTDTVLLFTNQGKYIAIPVHELPDIRWKDMGQHISNIATIEQNERIIQCIPVREFSKKKYLLFFTKQGMVKRTELEQYETNRFSRSMIAVNLRDEDEVVNVHETDGEMDIFVATNKGYGLWFDEADVSTVGLRALGVIAIQLKEADHVVSGYTFAKDSNPLLFLVTQRGACKRMNLSKFDKSTRARRGLVMLRELKSKPHYVEQFYLLHHHNVNIELVTKKEKHVQVTPLELPISERNSNGSFIIDTDLDGEIETIWHEVNYEKPFEDDEK